MSKKLHRVECDAIDKALVNKKAANKLMNWPPSRGPEPKRKQPKTTPSKVRMEVLQEGVRSLVAGNEIRMELALDASVSAVAALTREQAEQLLSPVDRDWRIRTFVLDKNDLVRRKQKSCKVIAFGPHKRDVYKNVPTLVVDLDYPLSCTVRLTVPPYKRNGMWQSFPHLLWQVARAYKEIYKQWKRFGVWGHAETDLYFEGLSVTPDGRVVVHIGS